MKWFGSAPIIDPVLMAALADKGIEVVILVPLKVVLLYIKPGLLDVALDEQALSGLEQHLSKQGYYLQVLA